MHGGVLLSTSGLLAGCGLQPIDVPLPPECPTAESARVAAVLGRNLAQMTRDALDALGGIETIVHPGETVFVKPNLVGAGMAHFERLGPVGGEITKPEIIVAIVEECLRAGAAAVIVGDGGQVPRFHWENLTTLDGATNLAAEAARLNAAYGDAVTLACLNADSPAWGIVYSPYTGLGEISVSSLATRADRIISLPVLKTHRFAGITASLKNLMGVTPLGIYGHGSAYRTGLHGCPGGLDQVILDIVAGLQPDLTLIDVSICCEGNGPHVLPGWWGDTVDVRDRLGDWLILASTDLVAADATAARIMGHDVDRIPHIAAAHRRGLGQSGADRIELLGARLDDLRMQWRPADPAAGLCDVLIPGIALLNAR